MAHSLEVRVPFLDHQLVEFCARIPSNLKVRGLTGKHLLREVARDLVPERVLEKRKVGFFRNSVSMWLENQATGEIGDWLLTSNPRYAEFLDQSAVRTLVRDHLSGDDRSNTYLLLAILMLEVWLSSFLPRVTAPSLDTIRIPA
jgi:asparagine synthase (glutamine-hydrolysing)